MGCLTICWQTCVIRYFQKESPRGNRNFFSEHTKINKTRKFWGPCQYYRLAGKRKERKKKRKRWYKIDPVFPHLHSFSVTQGQFSQAWIQTFKPCESLFWGRCKPFKPMSSFPIQIKIQENLATLMMIDWLALETYKETYLA